LVTHINGKRSILHFSSDEDETYPLSPPVSDFDVPITVARRTICFFVVGLM